MVATCIFLAILVIFGIVPASLAVVTAPLWLFPAAVVGVVSVVIAVCLAIIALIVIALVVAAVCFSVMYFYGLMALGLGALFKQKEEQQ